MASAHSHANFARLKPILYSRFLLYDFKRIYKILRFLWFQNLLNSNFLSKMKKELGQVMSMRKRCFGTYSVHAAAAPAHTQCTLSGFSACSVLHLSHTSFFPHLFYLPPLCPSSLLSFFPLSYMSFCTLLPLQSLLLLSDEH